MLAINPSQSMKVAAEKKKFFAPPLESKLKKGSSLLAQLHANRALSDSANFVAHASQFGGLLEGQ